MTLVAVRVVTPFVMDHGYRALEGRKMILKKAVYLRYRGLDYLGRLCVRERLGEREYLRFIEGIEQGYAPHDPAAVLIYVGGCCLSEKPQGIQTENPEPPERTLRLAEYGEALKRFYADFRVLTEAERAEKARAVLALRASLNNGCRGCKKKRAREEQEVQALENDVRRKAGAELPLPVELA